MTPLILRKAVTLSRWLSHNHPLPCRQTKCISQVTQHGRSFRLAIIGSGPAGFYTAYKVMSKIKSAKVDMYDHLPVPFGLVRFGVAPDHPEVKVGACSNRLLLVDLNN